MHSDQKALVDRFDHVRTVTKKRDRRRVSIDQFLLMNSDQKALVDRFDHVRTVTKNGARQTQKTDVPNEKCQSSGCFALYCAHNLSTNIANDLLTTKIYDSLLVSDEAFHQCDDLRQMFQLCEEDKAAIDDKLTNCVIYLANVARQSAEEAKRRGKSCSFVDLDVLLSGDDEATTAYEGLPQGIRALDGFANIGRTRLVKMRGHSLLTADCVMEEAQKLTICIRDDFGQTLTCVKEENVTRYSANLDPSEELRLLRANCNNNNRKLKGANKQQQIIIDG
ncbi:hypothetical protein GPALN_015053 [Globodera pallida]|nr:hypothetical protein GPALN_015053 [Globodera pallida]